MSALEKVSSLPPTFDDAKGIDRKIPSISKAFKIAKPIFEGLSLDDKVALCQFAQDDILAARTYLYQTFGVSLLGEKPPSSNPVKALKDVLKELGATDDEIEDRFSIEEDNGDFFFQCQFRGVTYSSVKLENTGTRDELQKSQNQALLVASQLALYNLKPDYIFSRVKPISKFTMEPQEAVHSYLGFIVPVIEMDQKLQYVESRLYLKGRCLGIIQSRFKEQTTFFQLYQDVLEHLCDAVYMPVARHITTAYFVNLSILPLSAIRLTLDYLTPDFSLYEQTVRQYERETGKWMQI